MNRGKKLLLQTMGREMTITTHGFDDIPEGPNVFVANHACMRDIFAIPARLPESEGGQVIVDNSWGTMNGNDLRDHLTGF